MDDARTVYVKNNPWLLMKSKLNVSKLPTHITIGIQFTAL